MVLCRLAKHITVCI